MNRLGWLSLSLIAFAANSILCRLALENPDIDAVSFSLIRLFSGALTLVLLLLITRELRFSWQDIISSSRFISISFLLIYTFCFSFAYLSLDTATGALLLFGTVQLFILGANFLQGHRLNGREWLGFALACLGFLLLVLPYVSTPDALGLALMIFAGVGWAIYTLKGKNSQQALADTGINFLGAAILAIPISLMIAFSLDIQLHSSQKGLLAAIASGSLASGIGYAIWYKTLPLITHLQAASSQLLVPVLAGIGGILFLQETLTSLILIAGSILLLGIFIIIRR